MRFYLHQNVVRVRMHTLARAGTHQSQTSKIGAPNRMLACAKASPPRAAASPTASPEGHGSRLATSAISVCSVCRLVYAQCITLFEHAAAALCAHPPTIPRKYRVCIFAAYAVCVCALPAGLWTKDMKARTNLAQPHITKILKTLEARKLVKSVKNVNNPSRKVYMAYELEPSRELTGGAWCVLACLCAHLCVNVCARTCVCVCDCSTEVVYTQQIHIYGHACIRMRHRAHDCANDVALACVCACVCSYAGAFCMQACVRVHA